MMILWKSYRSPEYEASYQAADGTAVSAVWKSTNQFTAGNTAVPEGVSAVGGKLVLQQQPDPVSYSFLQMLRDSVMWQLSLDVKNVQFSMKKCLVFYLIWNN